MLIRKSYCFIFAVVILTATLLPLTPVHSQIMYGRPTSGDVHVLFSHWSLKGDTTREIDQFTVPFTGFVPIQDNLEMLVYLVSSSNTLTEADVDHSLSGLGDVRLQVNRSFSDDHFLASVGFNLPTGKKKLTLGEEMLVLEKLSQNYLSFPMRRFGEGFGFNVLIGGAQMMGALRCGAGVMYQYNGKYEPYQGSGDYDPGDFISVNGGADWQREKVTVFGDVIFTSYFKDKLNGAEVFKQSTQLDLRLGAGYDGPNYGVNGQIGYVLRGRNAFYNPVRDERIFGNEFRANVNLTRRFEQGWSITPSGELKLVGPTDSGFGSCTIFGFGGSVGRTFGKQLALNIGGKYFLGNADDNAIDLSGFQLAAGLTASM
jgi:hypothetical protein